MQISIEITNGLERRLTISLPSEQFEQQISERLGKAAQSIRLPGFRPGKIPMKEVRRRYGPAVRAEVAGELMQSSFVEAIGKESLSPAGSPTLDVVKMDPGIDFEFTATFEVFPNVELTDLSKLQIKRPQAQITDADLEQMIERLREQRTEHVAVERAAAEGDQVTVDFVGTLDGETFDGGSGEGVSFVVGAGQMIEDFDSAVRGMSSGEEKEFPATFPDDYNAEHLQGKTATFTITVKEVAESKRPELDDEFFKAFGVEEGGEEAFRKDVRENMQREMDGAARNQLKSQVMDQLHANHTVQLPGVVVSNEIQALKQQMLQQFQMYGQQGNADQIDLPDDLFTEQAERRVAVGLIVNEIVSKADLSADPERVKQRIEEMASGYAEPAQVINYYMSNAEQRQQIEMAVLEDQVVDHILDQASIEEVVSNYNDVISGQAIAPEQTDEDLTADVDTGEGETADAASEASDKA
jgi:trigger factor